MTPDGSAPRPPDPSGTVRCPSCGADAVVSLVERVDETSGAEGHVVEFACPSSCPPPDDAMLLCLWAAVRSAVRPATSEDPVAP